MINAKIIKKLVSKASELLEGEWLLMGGTVLPLVGIDHRITTDIDLVCLDSNQSMNRSNFLLMEIAETLGLAPESINQAGAFFVERLKVNKKDLVLVAEGKKAKIFRPSGTLYLLLKIERLTESDLMDCEEWIRWCQKNKEAINGELVKKRLEQITTAERKTNTNSEKIKRLNSLKQKLLLKKI